MDSSPGIQIQVHQASGLSAVPQARHEPGHRSHPWTPSKEGPEVGRILGLSPGCNTFRNLWGSPQQLSVPLTASSTQGCRL